MGVSGLLYIASAGVKEASAGHKEAGIDPIASPLRGRSLYNIEAIETGRQSTLEAKPFSTLPSLPLLKVKLQVKPLRRQSRASLVKY